MQKVSDIDMHIDGALSNDNGTGKMDKIHRSAYLNSKGIKPNAQFHLDLIFPKTIGEREDLRHIPNDYARSSTRSITEIQEGVVWITNQPRSNRNNLCLISSKMMRFFHYQFS